MDVFIRLIETFTLKTILTNNIRKIVSPNDFPIHSNPFNDCCMNISNSKSGNTTSYGDFDRFKNASIVTHVCVVFELADVVARAYSIPPHIEFSSFPFANSPVFRYTYIDRTTNKYSV